MDVYSLREDGAEVWTRHATGTLSAAPADGGAGSTSPPGRRPARSRSTSTNLYADLAERGYAYGPAFQGVRAVWRRDGDGDTEVFAEVALPDELRDERRRLRPPPGVAGRGRADVDGRRAPRRVRNPGSR